MEKEFVPYEITLLPTDKPSRLYEFGGQIILTNEPTVAFRNQNIYITNSEEFKDGYFINCGMICKFDESKVSKEWITDEFVNGYSLKTNVYYSFETEKCKKIILTTDQDLIKDGVQAIDDEFLEWFVKNPSCEEVEVKDVFKSSPIGFGNAFDYYKIIIPKEEREQETLEEDDLKIPSKFCIPHKHYISDDDKICYETGYKDGAKWQKERMYSEEDIENIWNEFVKELPPINNGASSDFLLYLKQFKKK